MLNRATKIMNKQREEREAAADKARAIISDAQEALKVLGFEVVSADEVIDVTPITINKGQIVAKSLENISSDDVLEIFTLDGQSIYVKADNVLKNKESTISFNKLTSSKNERIDKKTISKNIVQKTYINRTRNNALIKNIQNDYINTSNINELSVGGSVIIKKDAPIAVNMWYKDNYVNLTGAIPDIAANRPVFEADIFKQFNKTGGTDFKLDKDDYITDVYVLDAGDNLEVEFKGKKVELRKLKTTKRDGKGTKVR